MPLTLVHFRVRDYAQLEHTYGNAVGTLLIDSLASFVQSTLRDMDLLARLEGGELIVMLPGSSASAAKIVGQRVRTSISLCPVPLGDHQIRLELDMGVASVQTGEDAAAAMESARAQLDATATAPKRGTAELRACRCLSGWRSVVGCDDGRSNAPSRRSACPSRGSADSDRTVSKAAVQLAVDVDRDDGVRHCGGHHEVCGI